MSAFSFLHSTSPRDSLPEHALLPGGVHAMTWPTLLIADHDSEMLQTLVCFFEKRGFHVAATTTLAEARTFLQRSKSWNLVISNFHLPDGTGLDLLGCVRETVGPAIPVLLMSGNVHVAALCAGTDYLAKPFPLSTLESRVRTLLQRVGA